MGEQLYLPIRPRPQPDELCSSWLLRVAAGSGMPFHNFRQIVAPRGRVPSYDFDRGIGVHQLKPIAAATLTDIEIVRSTLLRFDDDGGIGRSWLAQWILPVGAEEHGMKPVGYQYCPDCLATDTPYFRKSWRFSFAVACTKHDRELQDECGRCGAPVHAFLLGLAGLQRIVMMDGLPPFVRCVECGWDLRNRGAAATTITPEVLAVHRFLESLVCESEDASEYFWMLLRATELFSKEMGTLPFEFLRARHRATILLRATWLFENDRWRYIQSVAASPRPALRSRA